MANITDPKTGLLLAAPYQSNQFVATKRDRRWLAFFASRVVSDTACASLPASPVEGQAVIIAGGTNANAIARYSTELSAWEYLTPWAGLVVADTSGNEWCWSGSAWAMRPVASLSSLAAAVVALQAGGGSGSGGCGIMWPIDTPPATPNAWDDEFEGASLGAAWTIVNPNGIDSYGVANGLLTIRPKAPDATISVLSKPIDGDFTITGKFFIHSDAMRNYQYIGLIARNSSSGGIRAYLVVSQDNSATSVYAQQIFENPTTRTSYDNQNVTYGAGGLPFYLRLVRSGDALNSYGSMDGFRWFLRSSVSIAATIGTLDQVGIGVGNGGSATPYADCVCAWIRRS